MQKHSTAPSLKRPHHSRQLIVGWSAYFIFLYIYRCFCAVFFQKVLLKLTSVADTTMYQMGKSSESGTLADGLFDLGSTRFASMLTIEIGSVFSYFTFGNAILINIGFQTIAFVGIVYLLLSVDLNSRKYLAILVLLPSFSLWTSIASKEAIVVFALAIITGYLLRLYQPEKHKFHFIAVIAIFLIFFYKPLYLPAITFAVVGTLICQRTEKKAFVAFVGALFSIGLLYLFRDLIDEAAFTLQVMLADERLAGRSSRSDLFFTEKYDVFLKAPLGMALSLFGPKLTEIFTSPLALISFIESSVLFAFIFIIVAQRLMLLPVYNLILGAGTIFWLIFATYPLGITNIGSAVRYRSGWIILIFGIVSVLMSRSFYMHWQANEKEPNRPSSTKRGK